MDLPRIGIGIRRKNKSFADIPIADDIHFL